MKLPLWAWDPHAEKYIVMPLDILTQFEDGKWGLLWPVLVNRLQHHHPQTKDFFENYYHLFEVQKRDGGYWRYVLKEKNEKQSLLNPLALEQDVQAMETDLAMRKGPK